METFGSNACNSKGRARLNSIDFNLTWDFLARTSLDAITLTNLANEVLGGRESGLNETPMNFLSELG